MELENLEGGFSFGFGDHEVDKEVVGEVLRPIVLLLDAQFHHYYDRL